MKQIYFLASLNSTSSHRAARPSRRARPRATRETLTIRLSRASRAVARALSARSAVMETFAASSGGGSSAARASSAAGFPTRASSRCATVMRTNAHTRAFDGEGRVNRALSARIVSSSRRRLAAPSASAVGRFVRAMSGEDDGDVDRMIDMNDFDGDDEDASGGDAASAGVRVDADVDALLASVRTSTTWGGEWAEFVVFLVRLQSLGYTGSSVNGYDATAASSTDSKTPEWARGVSGGGGAAASSEYEEEEDLTPTDGGEIKRLVLSFTRDRPDLFARLPDSIVYQLIDWPLPRRMNNRKLNAGVQRLRAAMGMDVSHLRGKCSACDKLQDRQANPALQLSDLMRVLLALNEIEDASEFVDLPPKEAATECIRRLLRMADSAKPAPEDMPIDTSKVSLKPASERRSNRNDRRTSSRGEFGGRFNDDRRSDDRYGERGGRGRDRDRSRERGFRDDRRRFDDRYDDRSPRFERRERGRGGFEEFGSRFDDRGGGRDSFRRNDRDDRPPSRRPDDRFDRHRERPSYDNEGFRPRPNRSFDDRRDSGRRFDNRRPRERRGGDRGWSGDRRSDDVQVWRSDGNDRRDRDDDW